MKSKKFFLLFSLIISFNTVNTFAAENDLYTIAIPIASQDSEDRKAATKIALSEIIVRITGNSHSLEQAGIENILNNATDFVIRTQYLTKTSPSGLPQKYIALSFNPVPLKTSLEKIGLSPWQNDRPTILVWLIETKASDAHYLNDTDNLSFDFHQIVQETAKSRGIAMELPLLDITDRDIKLNNDKTATNQQIVEASKRYHSKFILIGYFSMETPERWSSQWYLSSPQAPMQLLASAKGSFEETVSTAFNQLSENLGEQFNIKPNNSNESSFLLHINDLKNYADYSDVEKYLHNISHLKSAKIISITNNSALFEITSNLNAEQLTKLFSLNQHLTATNNAANSAESTTTLQFSWQP